MTKKDYIILGNTLKYATLQGGMIDFKMLVDRLCTILKSDNPKFNTDKFKEYISYNAVLENANDLVN